MAACSPEMEQLILDRAAGDLDGPASAELVRHLATCAPCRAEADETNSVLGLMKLPEPTAHELEALARTRKSTRAALRVAERRDRWLRRASVGALGAAAAMVLVLSPGLFKKHPVNTLTVHTPPTLVPVADPEDDDSALPMSDSLADDTSSDDESAADASSDVDPDVDLPLSDVL